MAWQTPKTNWAAADGVRNTDMNRIESNTLEVRNLVNLAGAYQTPAVTKTQSGSIALTSDPIPTAWDLVLVGTEYTRNGYRIKASSYDNIGYEAHRAFRGTTDNAAYWKSMSGTSHSLMVELPEAIIIDKVTLRYAVSGTATMNVQTSTNGTSWTTQSTVTSHPSGSTEITLDNAPNAKYIRMLFTSSAASVVSVYAFRITDYTTPRYTAAFTLGNMPTMVAGQRVLIQTPSTFNTFGTNANTFNGLSVPTILQPGRKYELMYSTTRYTATEVS